MIKMLIIGKNIQNQTTKIQIAYVVRAGLDPLTELPGGQRPVQAADIAGFKRQNETTKFQIAYNGREGLEWKSAATGGERADDL